MALIGLLLNLAAITASVWANQPEGTDFLTLRPSEQTVVRYTNESLIVECRSGTPEVRLHWRSSDGKIIKEHKGRIHIEQSAPEQLKIVFAHISLADKGNWSCEDVSGENPSKSFNLIVYQKITFTENATDITVKEGSNATIWCEVKGEPQPNVTWNFDGQPITIDTNSTKFRVLADGLLINKVTQNDTGEYTCRAYQVNSIASDMQERSVLMKIEHKPTWAEKQYEPKYHAYYNGTVNITCKAYAQPPANFSWYRDKKHIQIDKYYSIESSKNDSNLTIQATNMNVFETYKCRAKNSLGSIERTYTLELGLKPPTPNVFKLRGLNSNKFDVELSSVRTSPMAHMEVNGYCIEYMTETEFKKYAGKWKYAKRRDFPFEGANVGLTFLLSDLEPNTTYLVRAASKNLAGFSDWTKVERFRTQSNEPPSSSARLEHLTAVQLLCVSLVALLLGKELSFGWQQAASITKLEQLRRLHL